MKKPLLVKIAIGILAFVAFAVLFMRSLEDTRTAAYTIERAHLGTWVLALEPHPLPMSRSWFCVLLRNLPADSSSRFFSRAMESLNSPAAPSIPLVLRGEFDRVVGERLTQEAMLAAARSAGIESTAPSPRCLVHRRISGPGGVRQVYLVSFDAPAITEFRRQVGLDADALSPVMFVAGAGADFNSWLPQRVNGNDDCLAPIEIGP